jgi:hypothetical protein
VSLIWIGIVLAVVIPGAVILSEFRWRDRRKAWTTVSQVALTLAGTFLGVSLALLASAEHQKRADTMSLIAAIEAANLEIKRSSEIVEGGQAGPPLGGANQRLVLQEPSLILHTLVRMPSLLELGSPELVADLSTLDKGLTWNALIIPQVFAPGSYLPNKESVLAQLRLSSRLLELQKNLLLGEEVLVIQERTAAWSDYEAQVSQ